MKIYLYVILSSILLFSQTRDYNISYITIEDGLSQNSVYSITQDSVGYIWLGTQDGLNRFDGADFKYYKTGDKPSDLVSAYILKVYNDPNGTLWVGTTNGLHKFDRKLNQFKRYFFERTGENKFLNNRIQALYLDNQNILWVGTEGGLIRLNTLTDEFKLYLNHELNSSSLSNNYVTSILKDSDEGLWFATYGGGLNYFNKQTEKFKSYFYLNKKLLTNKYDFINSLVVTKSNENVIWLGTDAGLTCFNKNTKKYINLPKFSNKSELDGVHNISALAEDSTGILWIGTETNGLFTLDLKSNIIQHYQYTPFDYSGLNNNRVKSIYVDNRGIVWVGTVSGGLNKIISTSKNFRKYQQNKPEPLSLNNSNVFPILQTRDGKIWVGTDGGINVLDRLTGRYTYYTENKNNLSSNIIRALEEDVYGNVWIGSYNGLDMYNSKTGKFTQLLPKSVIPLNKVFDLFIGSKGYLWIATDGGGLIKFDIESKKIIRIFRHQPELEYSIPTNYIFPIAEDSKGNLWIGSFQDGIAKYDRKKDEFTSYKNIPDNPNTISSNIVFSLYIDSDDIVWIGTYSNGLDRLNPQNNHIFNYSTKNGLPNDVIYSILEDSENNLWLSTNFGLCKFNPQTSSMRNYEVKDGLPSNEFNGESYYKSKNGEMFFGTINGFVSFFPEKLKVKDYWPKIVISDVKLFNKSVAKLEIDGEQFLKNSLEFTSELEFKYYNNVITFEFSALDYTEPPANNFIYKLDNFDQDWNELSEINMLTYNLSPGKYKFRVKLKNSYNKISPNEATLNIVITPPFWNTIWFKLTGSILIIIVSFGFFYNKYNREKQLKILLEKKVKKRTFQIEKQNKEILHQKRILEEQSVEIENTNVELEQLNEELEHRVQERTQELKDAMLKAQASDNLKTEFLAQVSHEIRTPVNVILSYIFLIKDRLKNSDDELIYNSFNSISNASKRIIRTIDLIINMSEIQAGTVDMRLKELNLEKDIITKVYNEFNEIANNKNIDLIIECQPDISHIIADEYTILQIAINLVDNAIKYTEKGYVKIGIKKQNSKILMYVSDTGIGISGKYLPDLFKPFSQEEQGYTRKFEGTGLGLSLVKKYCELNNAQIDIESKKNSGTTITIVFA